MRASFDVGGLEALATDLANAPIAVAKASREVVEETAIDLRDDWRKNATETAGRHGKHYPKSIRHRMLGFTAIEAEIGPTEGMKQAAMSFEYGSRNQPAHLDGQRALDENGPRLARRIEALRFL